MTTMTSPQDRLCGEVESSACRKAAIRLIPLLAIAYFVNYLDYTNIGFAALTMNQDLGLSASQFGIFPGVIFFLSLWFPVHYRTRMMTWFLFAIPMSSVLGGPMTTPL